MNIIYVCDVICPLNNDENQAGRVVNKDLNSSLCSSHMPVIGMVLAFGCVSFKSVCVL